jgi:hypothetical protein
MDPGTAPTGIGSAAAKASEGRARKHETDTASSQEHHLGRRLAAEHIAQVSG